MSETTLTESGLKFYFVLKDGLNSIEDVSTDLNIAFTNTEEYFKTNECIQWITEVDCLKLNDLTKKHIFILEEFKGKAFDYLITTKSLVIGPRCLINCLLESEPIPLGNSPVFSTAMRDLHISLSGLSQNEKIKMEKLICWMGGYCYKDLSSSCSHLVSNTVRSFKYEQAALNSICIMHPNWITDVWERSQKENILATSKEFEKHKLPIFYNLNITSTGLTVEKRNLIKDLVTENGGKYSGGFQSKVTDIVILEKKNTDSQKYKAAIEYKRDCLLPEWIFDSVKKGFAIPLKEYKVQSIKVSTPTRNDAISVRDFNPDATELSEISQMSVKSNCTINETYSNQTISDNVKSKLNQKSQQSPLELMIGQDIKKAGTFLDGCRIYVTGFNFDEKEKLNKILNSGGAIRYESMNENVTHVIVGDFPNVKELNSLYNEPHIVGIVKCDWLLESFKLRQPANENNFLFRIKSSERKEPEAPSPSSKKTIQFMNHSFKKPLVPRKLNLENDLEKQNYKNLNLNDYDDDEHDLLQNYAMQDKLSSSNKTPQKIKELNPGMSNTLEGELSVNFKGNSFEPISNMNSEMTCTEDQTQCDFFENLPIYVHEIEDETLYKQLVIFCENAGGKVVSKYYKQVVDYIIVPSERTTDINSIPVKGKNIVNTLWLEDAIYNNKIVEIEYYHKLIPPKADKKPLEGITIVISIYCGNERVFLQSLISILGGIVNDKYAKKQCPILVCPSAEGAKYEAAIKWNYPVVRADWLVECAKQGKKVDLHSYLVGNSIYDKSWNKTIARLDTPVAKNSTKQNEKNDEESYVSNRNYSKSKTDIDISLDIRQNESKDKNKSKENSIRQEIEDAWGDTNDNLGALENSILQHRRISEIAGHYKAQNNSPKTPTSENEMNLSDFVQQFSTPVRECIYEVCKEYENKETPQTQRLKKMLETPGKEKEPVKLGIPEFCTTPEWEKRKLEYLDKFYRPRKERRPITPLSEIRRRFWEQALGEHYWESPTRTFNYENESKPSTSKQNYDNQEQMQEAEKEETQNLNPTNEHIKHLTDFIKNREENKNNKDKSLIHENEDENENRGMLHKLDSEMGGTEQLIEWKDPSEFLVLRRSAKRIRFQGVPRFSISCAPENRVDIIDKIKSLKGEICENLVTYDVTCTHLVCEKPNRSEKVLSCIAAGKWILSLDYIEDSFKEGFFVDEEQYEWGNPKAHYLPKFEACDQLIANSAFRWRSKLLNSTGNLKGVFENFRVILHAGKKDAYQRLIEAGGGVVLDVNPPFKKNQDALNQATHCLVDVKAVKLTNADYSTLQKFGICTLSVLYLNEYLTNENPEIGKYIINM